MEIDLLINNAKIRTLDKRDSVVEQLAIHEGKVFATGTDCAGLSAKREIDLKGAVVVPGFNDSHAHSVWFGHTLLEVNLSECADLADLYRRVSEASANYAADEWVVCSGFNQMDTGGKYPDPNELSVASGMRPVWIKHTSGHSCIINQVAIEKLGVTGKEDYPGGSVVVDEAGNPTGVLEETAMAIVQDLLLPAPVEQIIAALEKATAVYVSEGLTSVTDAGIGGGWIGHSPQEFVAYQRALADGKLLTRMQPMFASDVLTEISAGSQGSFTGIMGGISTGFGDERLQLGPVKIFLDGSILGNTARMSGGYDNCPGNHGYFQGEPEDMKQFALEAARAGWALAMHAVGDEAIDLALEILETLDAEGTRPPMPHRLEHGGVVYPQQVQRLAKVNVTVVPQPYFMRVFGDGFRGYIGDERSNYSYRLKSLLDAGLPLTLSSDRPVSIGAPLKVMQAAVERETLTGWVFGPAERLTPKEALHAYTVGSAEVTGWGDSKGRLAAGFLADFVVLGADPLEEEVSKIGDIEVLATVIGGLPVFDPKEIFAGE